MAEPARPPGTGPGRRSGAPPTPRARPKCAGAWRTLYASAGGPPRASGVVRGRQGPFPKGPLSELSSVGPRAPPPPSRSLVLLGRTGLPGARHRIYNPSVSRASSLYRLQQTDLSIDQAQGKLAAVEAELAEHGPVERARQVAAQAEHELRQSAQDMRAAEDAVATQREKLAQVDGRLYGGAVHNPKELQELQAEAEALRRHLASLEDRLLEVMQIAEDAETAMQGAQARLELAEADSSGRESGLRKQRETLTG